MLRFVWQKIRNKRWLIASLLIGNLLLVAIAAANPLYTKAALQRMLTRTMGDNAQESGRYPSTVYFFSSSAAGHSILEQDARFVEGLNETLGVEPLIVLRNRFISNVELVPELSRITSKSTVGRVGTLEHMEDHIEIVSGKMFANVPDENGVVDAIVSEKCMVELGLMQGEIISAENVLTADESPLKIRISGVFRASEPQSEADSQFWYRTPSSYIDELFVAAEVFDTAISDATRRSEERSVWYWIFDYHDLTVDNCMAISETSRALKEHYMQNYYHSYNDYFSDLVDAYQIEAAKVAATLRILQVPIYVLLAAFIFMVSRQMLELEAAEIAVIKSRGASGRQIICIYTLQSALLAAVSLVVGIPLAVLVCQVIGSANAFLEFVSRSSLQLKLTGTELLYGAVAALLGMAAMVLPVIRYSRTSIVARKRSRARKGGAPLWQRLFLDVVLLAVSLYGLYSFRGQEAQITEKVRSGAGLDPLIYLASSLFIIACGLLALRIIPLLVKLVYRLGRRWWSPSLYASYLWVMRSKGGGYIMTFLVVTIALGIFNASTARTVNSNETDRICYTDGGADVVIMEQWRSNADMVNDDDTGRTKLAFYEPDYNKYTTIPGVESVTKVIYDRKASVSIGARSASTVTLMGIHTKQFGETAALKDGLLPEHFHAYLNAISQKTNAILVSANLRDKYGFSLGDSLSFRDSNGNSARGIIYGFVEYWPAYQATTMIKEADGTERAIDNLLVIANLGYLQAQWGVTPYQVWMRMAGGDTTPVYEFVEERNMTPAVFRDQSADLVAMKNDPAIQGTNGILTVGFVVALMLCTVGFLIYWILAIQSRALQFGIFRAMGMSMGEIVLMLFNEQIYVSGLSIAIGAGAGILASKLYVPLVQLAYVKAEIPLPLAVSLAGSDVIRLLAVVLLVMAVCMVILGTIIRKLKIAQALKLGED